MKNPILLAALLLFACCAFAATPTVSAFSPLSAASGMRVVITGTNFTNVSGVSFGGTPAASFTVNSSTKITAVVAIGSSGQVQVTNPDGAGSLTGFIYVPTSGIITDFGGYWPATAVAPNTVRPDSSHHLLAFTYNGTTFSTGVNDALLSSRSVSYTAGNFRALPVAGISGSTPSASNSVYLALAKKVDGSASVGNTPAVAHFSVKSALVDGVRGLDLGTGFTNLPKTAVLTFQIYNIDATKISDNEPDLILTQIAQPEVGNDEFSFIDASGNVVGTTFSQDMTLLPKFGDYNLDLFNLTPSTPYNTATAYSSSIPNTSREMRLVGVRLSDFGITASNWSQVKALRITPSGNSDYAFIAYNANSINLPPNLSQNAAATNTTICSGGTANLGILATAAGGGTITYSWEESTNGGTSWTAVTNGGKYSGATTNVLSVTNAANGSRYRAIVHEEGNANPATSAVFTITVSAPAPPTSVSVSGTSATCLHTPVQLTATPQGGSNLYYQWQSNAAGSYQNIPASNANVYTPPVNQTGAVSYRVIVSSGNGCPGVVSHTPATVTVTGIASAAPVARCESGTLTLTASATSSDTIRWYTGDTTSTPVATGASFTTPVLSASRTYYVASSGCASALRVPVAAIIDPVAIGGAVAGSTTVAPGTNSTTLTLGGHNGSIAKWQSSTDNFQTNVTDIAHTSSQLTVANLGQTTSYRAVIQSGSCAPAFSSPAIVAIDVILPIRNGSLRARKQGEGILLQWTAYGQQQTEKFEIEKSTDGSVFTKVHTVLPADRNSGAASYTWLDEHPATGKNFYRIKEVYNGNRHEYSSTVVFLFGNSTADITLFPNPVSGRNLQLQFNGISAGSYQLQWVNNAGQVIQSMTVHHSGGAQTRSIELPQTMPSGVYRLQVSGPANFKGLYNLLVL